MRVTAETRFAIIPEWVLFSPISPTAVRLYGVLARHADKEEHFSIVGRAKLAEQMRCARDTVDRALLELVGIGAVSIERRSDPENPNHLLPNRYLLAVAPPEKPAGQGRGTGAPTRTTAPPRTGAPRRTGAAARTERLLGSQGSGTGNGSHIPKPLSLVPEAEGLCSLLADLVEENGSKRPNVTRTWLVEADRIYRLDRRPPDEVERVLRWSQADGFWRANVLSIPTFRRQYDRLRLAASRPTSRAPDRASEIFAEAQALREAGL